MVEWEEMDLTPFGRVVERLKGLNLGEVAALMESDPEVREAAAWLARQQPELSGGC